MKAKRKKRMFSIIVATIVLSTVTALILYALRQNISLYLTPSELIKRHPGPQQNLRLGGLVLKNSVQRHSDTLTITFVLSDGRQHIPVHYTGIMPSLFRTGQGIIAEGHMTRDGFFQASMVLAKHDEDYHPPRLACIKETA